MICCLAVHEKAWDVYGRKTRVMSKQTKTHLIQLLESSSSKHCPDCCVFAELNGMNSGDYYMKRKERELFALFSFYPAIFLQFQGENIPLSCLATSEINLLAFFHWPNNIITNTFSSLFSSLVNTYDNTSDCICFLFLC